MAKPLTPNVWASGKTFAFQPSSAQQAQGFDYIATLRPNTGAPITDDHDWPLNQVTASLKWLMDQIPDGGLKYGCPLVGALIHWPLQQMPQEIWPDCGMTFIPYIAQSFDPVKYPLLKVLHPSGVLPADMRGEFTRGWDNSRGVDAGRVLMSAQSATSIGKYLGNESGNAYIGVNGDDGQSQGPSNWSRATASTSGLGQLFYNVKPRNISWHMIVRAS